MRFSAFAFAVFLATPALAGPWEDSIQRVEALMDKIEEKADRTGVTFAGSAYNGLDAEKHVCSILGRMLDKKDVVAHLEVDYPWQQENDGHALRVMLSSLDSWVSIARNLSQFDEARKVTLWNLECAGEQGIPANEAIEQAETAFYDITDDGKTLKVLGAVERGFAAKLRSALNANPSVELVSLGSPGGFVGEAMIAGREIRRRGLDTQLYAACYSACPLVFIGGRNRLLWQGITDLGFHKVSEDGVANPINSPIYVLIAEYVVEMGVDPRAILPLMWSAEPNEIKIAEPELLCQSKIATWIQREC